MKILRFVVPTVLSVLSLLAVFVALSALAPGIDVARMLVAANGSIIRGFTVLTGLGLSTAWLAARLWRNARPGLARASRTVAVVMAVAGTANVTMWLAGMHRRDISFVSDGTRLEGTLMLPSGVDRPPAVIIVHGSALLARDFYAVWGRHLVREGIAVFVYDKRGTGASDGTVPQNNDTVGYLTQLGRDAGAAFSTLERQPDLDTGRISLLGISQGGWTVPVAATLQPHVFRLAFLSGPVTTTRAEAAFSRVVDNSGRQADDRAAIQAGDLAAVAAPEGGFDPVPYLSITRSPACWFFGDLDRSIPVTLSRQHIDELSAAGRNLRVVMFAGADHLLLDHTWAPIGFVVALMPQLATWLKGS